MKSKKKSKEFISCNGLLQLDEEEWDAIIVELSEIANCSCTLQEVLISEALYKKFTEDKKDNLYFIIGKVFTAGAVLGAASLRARKAKKTY